MAYRINGVIKDGKLALEPLEFLTPFEKISSLRQDSSDAELTPLFRPFWEMKFPKGVYERDYEEAHFLNKLLVSQRASFLMGNHRIDPRITSIAAEFSRPTHLIEQTHLPDWVNVDNNFLKEHLDSIEASRKATSAVGNLGSLTENFHILGSLKSFDSTAQTLSDLDSITRAATIPLALTDIDSITRAATIPQTLSNLDSITRAAIIPQTLSDLDSITRTATIPQTLSNLDSIAQAAKIPNYASSIDTDSKNPYEQLLKKVPEISSFEHREADANNFMDEHYENIRKKNARLEEKEKARDKLQREQVELAAQHLKLNAEQFEEGRRVQAQQDKTEKKIFWLTVFVAGVTTLGFLVTAIGLFFDTQEVRSLFSSAWGNISDLVASAKSSLETFVSSLSADDVDDQAL